MIARDLAWRAAGGAMVLLGCASTGIAHPPAWDPGFALIGFGLAIAGIVFAVQGKRVALALRIERSRHRHLPDLVHGRQTRGGAQRQI